MSASGLRCRSDIRIDTVVGEGTSIKLYLPRVDRPDAGVAQNADGTAQSVRKAVGGMPTVLVVDDDAHVREITATRLAEAGYEVREAASGLQARALMETDPCIELAVLDFAMTGMNGAQLTAKRRCRPRSEAGPSGSSASCTRPAQPSRRRRQGRPSRRIRESRPSGHDEDVRGGSGHLHRLRPRT